MEIKVFKQNWEIISSGYVVVADGDTIDFSIEGLNFKLTFETEEGVGPRVGMKYEKEGDYMAIICQNFDNSNFRTVSQPLLLAKKNGRDIALELSVMSTTNKGKDGQSIGNKETKVLFYCWCISKKTTERHSG